MSVERRNQLMGALIDGDPKLGRIVSDQPGSMLAGNWDMVSYCYQQSFAALWDHAVRETSGLAVLPLMMLWRQSVELSIKAAIRETTRNQPPPHHRLTDLFDQLKKARAAIGCLESDEDQHTAKVRRLIVEFQKIDQAADRYRYPTDSDGAPYGGIDVDLDKLFQAHELITGWCDGANVEAEHYNLHVRVGD